MNAIEFVKKHGLQEAIKVVDLHPVSTLINIDGSCVSILDLKQIVEAFELVEKHGGLFQAKCQIENESPDAELGELEYYVDGNIFFTSYYELSKAINLVEQCQ